ncbi:hypothetical protein [Brevundimonas sp.]|uniref:hypothetical protein n=1 Tax=Brevundimonas sp. TaxID=1871086 RepID=UPI0028967033|nr:hypothetical protein [Brevundimonas sp.]
MTDNSVAINVVASSGYDIERTGPRKIVRHDISDEELDQLCDGAASTLSTWLGVAAGGFFGSFPNAISALSSFSGNTALSLSELSSLMICGVAASLWLALGLVSGSRTSKSRKLRLAIRGRSTTKPYA